MLRRTRTGFTLLELLVVIGILVLLAGAAVPMYMTRATKAKVDATKAEITGTMAQALDLFRHDMNRYPTANEGLKILQSSAKPEGEGYDNWAGPYLDPGKKVQDAWGKEYQYNCDEKGQKGEKDTDKYDLSSAGPDGQHGSDDDIVNWSTEEKK